MLYLNQKKKAIAQINKKRKRLKKNQIKNIIPYALIGCIALGIGAYFVENNNKIEELNSQIVKKEQKLDEAGKELDEKKQKIKEKDQELDKVKNEEKEIQVVVSDEATLYSEGLKLKKNKDYEGAIVNFKHVIDSGKSKQYISESIYEVASLNEKLGNNDIALTYYKQGVDLAKSQNNNKALGELNEAIWMLED